MKQGTAQTGAASAYMEDSRTFASVVSCLCCESFDEAMDEQHGIMKEFIENHRRVVGNRSLSSPVSWSDLRLMCAADLRTCLEYLENHE